MYHSEKADKNCLIPEFTNDISRDKIIEITFKDSSTYQIDNESPEFVRNCQAQQNCFLHLRTKSKTDTYNTILLREKGMENLPPD